MNTAELLYEQEPRHRVKHAKVEQADGHSRAGGKHQRTKKRKVRAERRAARRDPETPPTYTRYNGYNT
jgi:hypothetical protein